MNTIIKEFRLSEADWRVAAPSRTVATRDVKFTSAVSARMAWMGLLSTLKNERLKASCLDPASYESIWNFDGLGDWGTQHGHSYFKEAEKNNLRILTSYCTHMILHLITRKTKCVSSKSVHKQGSYTEK